MSKARDQEHTEVGGEGQGPGVRAPTQGLWKPLEGLKLGMMTGVRFAFQMFPVITGSSPCLGLFFSIRFPHQFGS